MADNIVTFKDDFPIIGSVKVADQSQGYEAASKAAGQFADFAGKQAASMAEEKSKFSLMEANNSAEDLKTSTKIDIKMNPDQADSIMNAYDQTASSIKQNTSVNKYDRAQLDTLLNNDKNDLRVTAAGENLRIQKRNAEIKIWTAYPTNMKSLQDAIDTGNMDLAKKLSDTITGTFRSAAYADVVSAQQYANVIKSTGMLYDRAAELHRIAGDGDSDAQDYHRANGSPFNNDSTDNHRLPVNQNTAYLHRDGMNDKTMAGVESSILNGTSIPFSTAASSDENYSKTLQWLNGKNEAKSLIDSGNKFKIDTRISDLDSKSLRSPTEEMEYKVLKNHQQRLLHGESQALMADTPLGSQIVRDFNDRLNAIKVGGYSDGEAQKLTRDAYNNYVDESISYWDAQHIDPRMNQPIPPEIVAPIAQSFEKGGDANVALERFGYLQGYQKQAYAARAMPNPVQRETMQTIALANNSIGVRPEWKRSLIEAQQPKELKDLALDTKKSKEIKSQLASQLGDVLTYVSIGTDASEPRSQAILDMAYNKVVYDGMKKGDLTLSGSDDYIKDFVDNIKLGYNITSGITNTANLTQLNISQGDWSYISRHEQNEVYKNLAGIASKGEMLAAIDRNPVMTVLTQTNQVVVLDSYGNVLSSHPYSDKLRMKAVRDVAAEDVETIAQQKRQGSMGGLNPISGGY